MNAERTYRICATCGDKWNVSRISPGPKKYVCPHCESKAKEGKRDRHTKGS